MKTFKIETRGTLSPSIQNLVSLFNDKKADKNSVQYLDSEITFVVCDLKEAHGNLNKYDKTAWLCPKNGDDSFNVSISW